MNRAICRPAEPPALLRTPRPSLTYWIISNLLVLPIYRLLFRGNTAGNANTATVNLSTTALTITPGLNFSVATGAAATVYTAAAWMQ